MALLGCRLVMGYLACLLMACICCFGRFRAFPEGAFSLSVGSLFGADPTIGLLGDGSLALLQLAVLQTPLHVGWRRLAGFPGCCFFWCYRDIPRSLDPKPKTV